MEWRINDEAFVIWLSQRWREMNLLQHNADNGIAYSRFHLFPFIFLLWQYILKKREEMYFVERRCLK